MIYIVSKYTRNRPFHLSFLGFADEQSECDWSPSRFQNIIDLRQEALDEARRLKVNYLLVSTFSDEKWLVKYMLPEYVTVHDSPCPRESCTAVHVCVCVRKSSRPAILFCN